MTDDDLRARGIAKMHEVYQFSVDPDQVPGEFVTLTVDHLFGTIWTRPGLDDSRAPTPHHRSPGSSRPEGTSRGAIQKRTRDGGADRGSGARGGRSP